MRIAREGLPFIAAFLAVAALPAAAAVGLFDVSARTGVLVALPGALLAVFSVWFFRDPDRTPPADPLLVVAPADGRVVAIREGPDGASLAIFLSVFDVHVNRAPFAGEVVRVSYREGRFLAAFNERASSRRRRDR